MEYHPNESNFLSVGLSANTRQWNAAADYLFKEYLEDSLVISYENRERTLRDFLFLSSNFLENLRLKRNIKTESIAIPRKRKC